MFKSTGGYNTVPEVDGVELGETTVVRNPLSEDNQQEVPTEEGKDRSELKAVPISGDAYYEEIRVLDIKGRTYKMNNVPLHGTVGDLKALVEEETDVPISLQRLIYGGRQLNEDDMSLEAAKVKNNTVIHVFQRPPPAATPLVAATEMNSGVIRNTEEGHVNAQHLLHDNGSTALEIGDVFEPELQEYRRRVKFLALILLFVSILNLVTLVLILMDSAIEPTSTDEKVSLLLELVVNTLGLMVGLNGVQGTNTLDPEKVKQYCFGLVVVGGLYISIDVYGLVRSVIYSNKHSAHGSNENDNDVDTGDKDKKKEEEEDPVGASVLSLFFTLLIWSICFFRAFQFRYHLHVALSQDDDVRAMRTDFVPEADAEEVSDDIPTAQARLQMV